MAIRQRKVLSWNISGINSEKKWNAVQDRISENDYDVVCLQETKRSHFDSTFIRQFCPVYFDCFVFLPSNGASGGSIIIWKSSVLSGSQCSKMTMLLLFFSPRFTIIPIGFLLIFVHLALLWEKEILFSGFRISTCLMMLIG